jgi:hypothetical protein
VIGVALLFAGKYGVKLEWRSLVPDFAYVKRTLPGIPCVDRDVDARPSREPRT